jgi:hypothetical protein
MSNDWQPPEDDTPDSPDDPSSDPNPADPAGPQQPGARQPGAQQTGDRQSVSDPPATSARTADRPPPQTPSIDKAFQTLKTLLERSFNNSILFAYLAMFGVSTLVVGVLFAGVGIAAAASGVFESSGSAAAGPMLVVIGGAYLLTLAGMIAWQTLLIGFQRPMYRLMFEDPNRYASIGGVLREAASRFFPILGVNFIIGLVVYGGGLAGAAVMALPALTDAASPELGLVGLILYAFVWLVASLAVGFFFAPATYFAATREIGVVDALTKSFAFVRQHLVEMAVAWAGFLVCGFAFGTVNGILSIIPCLGALVSLALSLFVAFAGICYWASIFMMLEDESDPSREIIWQSKG